MTLERLANEQRKDPKQRVPFGILKIWYPEQGDGQTPEGVEAPEDNEISVKIYFQDFWIRQVKDSKLFTIGTKKCWRGRLRPCFAGETCSPGIEPVE